MQAVKGTAATKPTNAVARVLARKGGTAFLLNASGMGLAFLLQVCLARELGAISYGHYAYVMTVITFLVFPAKLGFDMTIVRYVSAYRADDRWSEIKGILRFANRWSLALSLAVVAIGYAVLQLYARSMEPDLYATFLIGLGCVPFLALALLRQSALQALNEVLYAQMPEKIIRPVLLVVCLYAAVWIGQSAANAPLAMALFGLSLLLTYGMGAAVLRRKTVTHMQGIDPVVHPREWMGTSISLMINAGIYLILGQLNVLMTGMIHGTYESGILSAAVRIAALVTFAMTAINMTAAPLMSAAYAQKDMKRLQSVCTASGGAALAFALVVLLVIAFFGRPILAIFGPEFREGYIPLLIMAAGQFVSALCGQTGMVMTMTGHQSTLTKALIVSAILNAALNLILIPSYGMTGAAIATFAGGAFWPFAMVFVVRRKLGIQTSLLQTLVNRNRRDGE
ncbi:flippase [Cohnella nanjingensis]|uniref:Flippase n=1 Tax=Cohnella nanjingensis TaxID=1387779 RepID=A0A7X0RZ97_9BACL|nr:flippase [Cohnella nanjingensis]MBB6674809.1 flippase [Cohnella nanjingensis]